MRHFAKKLSDRLEDLGITRYQLAKLLGLTPSAVLHITSGNRRPSDDLLRRLSDLEPLGVSLNQLLAWRALDDYGPEALALAYQDLQDESGS